MTPASSPATGTDESKLSLLAVSSLVFGLLGCTGIGGIAGLTCGIIARRRIRRSEGRLVGGWLATAGIILSVLMLMLLLAAALVLPGLMRMQAVGQGMTRQNLSRIDKALHFYAADNGNKLPPAENWCETLRPNLGARATELLRRPGSPSTAACGYGYNADVAGLVVADVNPQTVVLFELAAPECNVSGKEELLRHPGTNSPNDRVSVLLANGNVRWLTEPELKALRWKP